MKFRDKEPLYKCGICGLIELRFAEDSLTSVQNRLFRYGWVNFYNNLNEYHFCHGCIVVMLFGKSLNLSLWPTRDKVLKKFVVWKNNILK